ncbi:MAG: site-2 protease family protein [Candidatus Zambryskibacteria bacterium]|nr:site-2 protease family protein [Candidatus Zambryskibacteria bacterium]
MSIIIFIIILAVLIFVHELGHFVVAKKSGIRVDEFGLGFPPKIFAKKIGETTYTLNAIPFGGFVKIFGEDSHTEEISDADKSTSFLYKPKWVQASVLIAGVTSNIIFAWLLISLGFMIGLPSSMNYLSSEKNGDTSLVITEVLPNSPAQKAGLVSEDKIISISSGVEALQGKDLTPENIRKVIGESKGEVEVTYNRGNLASAIIFVKPENDSTLGSKAIGIVMDSGVIKLPIHLAFIEGANTTWILTKGTTVGLVGFLWKTITFKSDFSQVAGPVGIAKIVSQANDLGFMYILFLVALISINLAVINLLPFPALDGGRLLFVGIEAIIRKPIKPAVVQWANGIGFAFLIILMLVITGHDIFKLL